MKLVVLNGDHVKEEFDSIKNINFSDSYIWLRHESKEHDKTIARSVHINKYTTMLIVNE